MAKLALLVCDTPIPPVRERFGTYNDIFREWLRKSLQATGSDASFTLDPYDVVNQQYPSNDSFHADDPYCGVIITGSAYNAFDDLPWINSLVEFVAKLISETPHVKVIGICFGHQIICRAVGEQVTRNELGWEVGTTEVQLTEEGKRVFNIENNVLDIIEMHRDHVSTLPPEFVLLGSTPVSWNQGMVKRYPRSTQRKDAGQIHILTVQGHPEFSPDIVNFIIDAREKSGVMDSETVALARQKANKRDDGVGPIGQAVLQVLGLT